MIASVSTISEPMASSSSSSLDVVSNNGPEPQMEPCGICFEHPEVYGLLCKDTGRDRINAV
jgi:hypothetical protein